MVRSTLTPEQLVPATSREPRTYVEAAPGSGKTYLSVERYGYLRYGLLRSDHRGIAAVSFARSASGELRGRIVRRWGRSAASWPNFVGTIDELNRRVLRRLLEERLLHWPGGHTDIDVADSWRQAAGARSRVAKEKGWLRLVPSDNGELAFELVTSGHRPSSFYTDQEAYEKVLAEGRGTHDEVRSILAGVLASHGGIRVAVSEFLFNSFSHLLVDEAFDMNELDVSMVRLVGESGVGVTVVGDPWQSLYEFRGSRPKLMKALVATGYEKHTVLGSHRYRTDEMRLLAGNLALGQPFSVLGPEPGRRPDIVLAPKWTPLWEFDELPVLPAGIGTNIDGGPFSAALLLLLNEVTTDRFDVAVTGFAEASAFIGWTGDRLQLQGALVALADHTASNTDVWVALAAGLATAVWPAPGAIARARLDRLIQLVRSPSAPILGLSIHQAKGLQWPTVDLIHPSLQANVVYRLDQDNVIHRTVYVALTRARDSVRVRTVYSRF